MLTSDPAILVFSCIGLAATAVSIVRDARAQRHERRQLAADTVRQLVADDVRAKAA